MECTISNENEIGEGLGFKYLGVITLEPLEG
jgi:hypothetical protein